MQLFKSFFLFIHLLLIFALPVAGQYDFTVSDTEGCTPMKVKFEFTSTATLDTITSFYWDFGNGQTSNLESPDSVTYNSAGNYSVSLIYNNRVDLLIGKPDFITVHRTVPANFIYYDSVTYNTYVFQHTGLLESGTTYDYLWDFEEVGTRTGSREVIIFPSSDTFQVTLTVSDNFGCTSTNSQFVLVMESITVQNVFTPNGDNINDYFLVSSNGGFPLVLRIYTRAGTLVYENEGTVLTWDGKTASGQELNPGIYFYSLEALQGDPNKRFSRAGVLYLYK
jgi:gliding motility-associated-like protein